MRRAIFAAPQKPESVKFQNALILIACLAILSLCSCNDSFANSFTEIYPSKFKYLLEEGKHHTAVSWWYLGEKDGYHYLVEQWPLKEDRYRVKNEGVAIDVERPRDFSRLKGNWVNLKSNQVRFMEIHADGMSTDYPCDMVPEIKDLPFKDRGGGPVYWKIMASGDKCVPYLIGKLDDTTVTADEGGSFLRIPRNYKDITIGDISFFILLDITKYRFEDFLDKETKELYKINGVYAYFEYVKDIENRKKIKALFIQRMKDN